MKGEIEGWRELIEQGVVYREKYGWSKRWPVYRDYARGVFAGYNSSVNGILPYNIVYAMEKVLVPSIYFRNPYVNVTPRLKPNRWMMARVVESLDNWLIQEMSVKKEMKKAIINCYFSNRGILKVGYDSLYGYSPQYDLSVIGMEGVSFTQSGKKGERLEYNVNVKPGMPWCVNVLPDMFIVPFGVNSLEECPWVDHVIIRPLEDVKADPKYKNTSGLEGTHLEIVRRDPIRGGFFDELSRSADLVELHEIRDYKRREIKVMVMGYDKWLRKEEDKLQIEGLPFVTFTFNEDPEYFWGASDVQIIEPQQLEMNEARTQAMLHRRVALLKFLVEEGGMRPEEVDKMLREDVAPVAFVKGTPSQVVQMLQPHIPPDLVQWVEVIRSDAREIMGIGKMQAGEVVSGRKTATEAQIVELAHQMRMDERRDVMADALTELIRKVNQVVFKFWSGRRVASVVGVDLARYWVEFTTDEIRDEYDVKVDVESMTPVTKAMKKREIMQLIQALGKYPGANVDYLLRLLLRQFEWADVMKILPQAPETVGGAIPMRQFIGQQNQLLQQPQLLNRRAQIARRMIEGAL